MTDKYNEQRMRLLQVHKKQSIAFKRSRMEDDDTPVAKNKQQMMELHEKDISKNLLNSTASFLSLLSPYGQCPNVSTRYSKQARIGEGTYGVVYKALDISTSQFVALKRCLPHHQATDGFPITTLREIQILREVTTFRHPNIVQLLDVAVSSKESGVFLVFEYAHFDLATLIDQQYAKIGKSPFTVANVKRLSSQLISAVNFLHERNIIHRDLKLSNLLYQQDCGLLKLADFGLARHLGGVARQLESYAIEDNEIPKLPHDKDATADPINNDISNQRLTPKVVSLWYRPIELLLESNTYDEGVDLWGLGCIIAELLLGGPLLRGKNEIDQIQKIFTLLGPPTESSWPLLKTMPLIVSHSVEVPTFHEWKKTVDNSRSGPRSLLDIFGDLLTVQGIELLSNFLRYDPSSRSRTDKALQSGWYKEAPLPTDCRVMPTFQLEKRFV